ncbi:hypothetical protein N0V85_008783 [Neurospora sp. IMI 360204]|nr:hypothetical protein N0V85_008783 [Neurospora sp. IMI 360204]
MQTRAQAARLAALEVDAVKALLTMSGSPVVVSSEKISAKLAEAREVASSEVMLQASGAVQATKRDIPKATPVVDSNSAPLAENVAVNKATVLTIRKREYRAYAKKLLKIRQKQNPRENLDHVNMAVASALHDLKHTKRFHLPGYNC